jgi:hypothetical protein
VSWTARWPEPKKSRSFKGAALMLALDLSGALMVLAFGA